MARPGRFSDDEIITIRETYEHQRDLADHDPEFYETVLETEERLAERFGVSRTMIRRIVLGLAYADAGGPIDEQRQAAARESREEVNATELTVTRPGREPKVFIYPGGTHIGVRAVVADLDQFNDSGTPRSRSRSGDEPPAASPPMRSSKPRQYVPEAPPNPPAEAAKRQRDEIARLKELLADKLTPEHRKPALQRKLDKLTYRGDAPDSAAPSSGNI